MAVFAIGVALTALAEGACRAPTQVTIEIVAEVAHRPDAVVSVQLDAEGRAEAASPRVVTREPWPKDGTVGTVAATPGAGEAFVARVVLAFGREPETCTAVDPRGCIVARRRIHFVDGEATRARIVLRPACLGVFCDASSTCGRDGTCGSFDDDDGGGDAGGAVDPPSMDGGDPYASAILADRPRHYYRLDEPEGTAVAKDAVGRADGTYEEGVQLGATGALATSTNTGAFFDGAGGALTITSPDDLPGAASFEAWARADLGESSLPPTILERVDVVGDGAFGYRMSRPVGTSAVFELFRGGTAARAEARAFRFAGYTHVVAVARGGKIELYTNGILAETTSFDDQPRAPLLGPLVIGASRAGAGHWRGTLDEIAIYDYPLSIEQITRHRAAAGDVR